MFALPLLNRTPALVELSSEQIESITSSSIDWILTHPLIVFSILLAILLLWLCWDVLRLSFGKIGLDLEARQRAERLLRESVSSDEYQQLQQCGYLEVASTIHADRYHRIPRQRRRIQVFHAERKIGELCVVALDPVPDADLVLTHKWMIETNEEDYLALANWMRCTW